MNDVVPKNSPPSVGTAKLVYVLYLFSVLIGVVGIVAVVIAYVHKDDAPEWLRSHYQFQIRTFWMGLLYLVIGGLLSFLLIGYLVLFLWAVWLIIRSIKGMKVLNQQQVHPNPKTWLF